MPTMFFVDKMLEPRSVTDAFITLCQNMNPVHTQTAPKTAKREVPMHNYADLLAK